MTPDASPSSSAIASSPQHSDQLLLPRGLHRIVVRDAGGGLDHLGQQPVRSRLPRRRRRATPRIVTPSTPARNSRSRPALPHAGFAMVESEDVRTAVADRPRQRVLEQVGELRTRGRRTARRLRRALAVPSRRRRRPDQAMGLRNPAQLEQPDVLRVDRPVELTTMSGRADQGFSPGPADCWSRAGQRPPPRRSRTSSRSRRRQPRRLRCRSWPRPRAVVNATVGCHPERSADRALGVVLMGLRDAEGRHDGIPGELLHRAAVGSRCSSRRRREERRHTAARGVRTLCRDEFGTTHQIGEKDGCKLPFHTGILGTAVDVTEAPGPAPLALARARGQGIQGI